MKWVRSEKEYEEYVKTQDPDDFAPTRYTQVKRMYSTTKKDGAVKLFPLICITVADDIGNGYGGFLVTCSRKNEQAGWWHTCGTPHELSIDLSEMLGEYIKLKEKDGE